MNALLIRPARLHCASVLADFPLMLIPNRGNVRKRLFPVGLIFVLAGQEPRSISRSQVSNQLRCVTSSSSGEEGPNRRFVDLTWRMPERWQSSQIELWVEFYRFGERLLGRAEHSFSGLRHTSQGNHAALAVLQV